MAHRVCREELKSRRDKLGDAGMMIFNSSGDGQDDEEAGNHKRIRSSIMKGGKVINSHVVDVGDLKPLERHTLVEKIMRDIENDSEKFLLKFRRRLDKVGLELPTVEMRYQNLTVNAHCHIGSRALPTLWNTATNILQVVVEMVHLSPSKKEKITILKDVSGVIKPSRITLLLGPPGCGKTTLLKALAGMSNPTLKVTGNISYNGFELNEFVPQKTSAYISQYDLHIAEMTVRETFDFSARCQGVGSRQELLLEIEKREKEAGIRPDADIETYMKAVAIEGLKGNLQTDYILKVLGLDSCADIMIGNAMVRGVSGGQRKRVTTGELIVSPIKTLLMDDISTGLDSSTTFQIVKYLQQFVHIMEATVLISLLQPAPETFDLFDDIILMSEGQIVYHGPRDHVLDFFENCGFKCPDRKGTADFLQEVISRKDQEKYWVDKEKPYKYVTAEEFSENFKESHVGQDLSNELLRPYDKSKSHKASLSLSKYSLSKWELLKACFNRDWLLIKRNSFVYLFKTIQLVILAFITMTVFLWKHMETQLELGNYLHGALFFSIVVMMFNSFQEVPLTLSRLPVFFKQRDLYFFPAWAYTLPGFLLKIPHSLLESFLWTSMTYYVIGYSPEVGRFFRQFLMFFAIHQMASSLFRALAGICRTMVIANTGASLTIMISLVLSGYIIPRPSIPKWMRWAYWISPLSYGETAVTVNEFLAPRWRKSTFQNKSIGVNLLKNRGLFNDNEFYWIDFGCLIGFSLLFYLGYTLSLTYLNPFRHSQAVVSREKIAHMQDSPKDTTIGLNNKSNPMTMSKIEAKSGDELNVQHMTRTLDRLKRSQQGSHSAISMEEKRGMILGFQPSVVSFQNVHYYVDMPKEMQKEGVKEKRLQLLRDVTGAFRPAVLTALMGVSGAGKTTLMDVLAGRKTGGYIEGDIRISGFPKVQETFARISGYCEQNDIHSPQATVHESLLYSAWLRLAPEIDLKTKNHFVNEVMELVELDNLKDALVGSPGVSGLSTEQRKRLTIAVELVANPSIIFMDEPTSGLDARAAAIVMRAVRNTVDTGRTVVCTIHQPSIEIFEAFDELLLMKRGGEIIYAGALGHQSKNVIEYFEAIPGIPKMRDGYNPATWMLEVTSMAAEHQLGRNFAEIYRESNLFRQNFHLVKELSTPVSDAKDLYFPTQYAQNPWKQFTCCFWKQFWTYWRSPGYNLLRFAFTFISGLFFGIIYWQQGTNIDSEQDLFMMMGAMYAANIFLGINNCASVQPVVSVERQVFYREKAAGMYSGSVYAWAQVAIEFPYTLLQAILYGIVTYSMMGYHWSAYKFFWYLFVTLCTFLYFTYYGMLTVSISPNAQVASILASAFYAIFNLFSGFIVPRTQIPGWWVWYYWICPTSWTLNGLITSQYGDMKKQIRINGKSQQSVEDFLEDYFGFHRDMLGIVAAVLVIFPVFFAIMFAVGITRFNFQKR